MLRRIEYSRDRPVFANAAVVQDDSPVSDSADHSQVASDEQYRHPSILPEFVDQIQNRGLYFHIQCRSHFIADEDLRFGSKGSSDSDALALAPRGLARESRQKRWRQPHAANQGDALSGMNVYVNAIDDAGRVPLAAIASRQSSYCKRGRVPLDGRNSSPVPRRASSNAETSWEVYGWLGLDMVSTMPPCSTTRPLRSTKIRFVAWATVLRSKGKGHCS